MINKSLPIALILPTLISACSSNTASESGKQHSSEVAQSQPSLEEDFNYPGADAIFNEKKIRLLKGDGNMLLVDCARAVDPVTLYSDQDPTREGQYCFSVRGRGGYLTLQLPKFYLILTDSVHQTEVTLRGGSPPVTVPAGGLKGFGVADGSDAVTLIKLRAFQ